MTNNAYVEFREAGYYVRGTRVSLASVVHAFRKGASAEGILLDFPAIGELSRVYGAIAFILENPELIQSYLADQERLWDEFEAGIRCRPNLQRGLTRGGIYCGVSQLETAVSGGVGLPAHCRQHYGRGELCRDGSEP